MGVNVFAKYKLSAATMCVTSSTHFVASEETLRLIDESKATTFVFPETVFTTVTAYQNQQVRLKICCRLRLQ